MHIQRFTKDYTRRFFLEGTAKTFAGAGVLASVWDLIGNHGDVRAAYPDEAWDIETYSKGAVKVGGELNAGNVDSVKDMIDPITYEQVKNDGRIIDIVEPVTDATKLMPPPYLEATLRNQGQATFDAAGNVVTKDGKPWIGGNPFPNAQTAEETLAGQVLSWGRHDTFMTTVKEWDIATDGTTQYEYEYVWIEVQAVARTKLDPTPYMPGHEDKLRYNTVLFTSPGDVSGTSLLNVWDYDQRKFPDFNGFMPAFKRVRRFPTNQRFEPVVPGSTFFISDAWTLGDPVLTWGNFKLIGRTPWLGHVSAVGNNWNADDPNWIKTRVGGPKGNKYFRTAACVVPEAIVVEMEPTGYPRSPYSKKRCWFDARSLAPLVHVSFDRNGQIWKQWDIGTCMYQKPDGSAEHVLDNQPLWTWSFVHSYDVQSGYMSLLQPVKQVAGGYGMRINDPDMYENFCTMTAIRRLGT